MFVTKSAAWALRCGLAVSGRTEGLAGRSGWKVWLEGLAGRSGWKVWLEGLAGSVAG